VLSLAGTFRIYECANDESAARIRADATKKDWLVWRHELRLLFRPLQQMRPRHSPACRLAKISAQCAKGYAYGMRQMKVPLRAVNCSSTGLSKDGY